MDLQVVSIKDLEEGFTNQIYINNDTKKKLKIDKYVLLDDKYVFMIGISTNIDKNKLGLNKAQREFLNKVAEQDFCEVLPYKKPKQISLLFLSVEFLGRDPLEISGKKFIKDFKERFDEFPLNLGQIFYFILDDINYLKVTVCELMGEETNGIIDNETDVYLTTKGSNLLFTEMEDNKIFMNKNFSFEMLGIGGLKKEFSLLFRRAFVQRAFDSSFIEKLGIKHVKGIMLYGPPGTGKTLIASQIGTILGAKKPQIVNGPEILNKFVGQSEENIRNLFKDAEEEYKQKKEKSQLHIIIFDEIDAICKSRGTSTSSGIGDQVVNQLLSKMDGVESLDNVLVIGITNRFDLIDSALLRPGRFEIHLEISLPDEKSRLEILNVHTKKMASNNILQDVNLEEISKLTRNYTGAELAAVVKSAVSFPLVRKVELEKTCQNIVPKDEFKVQMSDFLEALKEVNPSFGVNEKDFSQFNKMFYEISIFKNGISLGNELLRKLKCTNLYNISSLLFHGPNGTGKTSLAVKIALNSRFPYVKIISPKNIIGLSEYEKVRYIKDTFSDSYKSSESIIILDDLENLIEYVAIGPRFSNTILQALKIFIKTGRQKQIICFWYNQFY
ncbi:SEC18-like vesicular fusionprotein [Tubulinosema ratisbonensis]|uniref:Vesicular-fusion protein SEC18 n=1 Tax=Tubulinosema ratisbonensis TaxID=291195 RepID=A0A437API6_9MICR|nr:SEC18-like vesicular fusionprotein [Tubulinosema ratisbonensis]